ncbi:ExbD/TolR family protein [Silanimonas lenta]|jgi:biopolymer transport protein ExbD|uniref:ExbD/TolR family protein n=1 Tax=Silanimonas lenta TaxID=265429 RepID=UPI00040E174A|nr:biopolymer transporter ExbD [Silanimonas lenta]GIX37311.1 MAG: biopolymer transport protein exbD2 [Silanimonas sp.]
MAFSAGSGSGPKADMNVVPLIDILLVLLIIFMVTAPTPASWINITLPQRSPNPPENPKEPPPPVSLKITSSGEVLLNNTPAPMATLQAQFEDISQVRTQLLPVDEQPRIEVEVDPAAEYEVLAKVLARAKNARLEKIAFVDQTPQ